MEDLDPLQIWKQQGVWKDNNHLALNILGLVDPNSEEARKYPHLHEVFSDRLDQSMSARDGDPVSKCHDDFPTLTNRYRADSHDFQRHHNNFFTEDYNGGTNDKTYRMNNMCHLLYDRMHPYAEIGSGSKFFPPPLLPRSPFDIATDL